MKKIIIGILAIALIPTPTYAAKTLQEWADAPEKRFFKKARLGNTMSSQHGLIKRVGIPDEQYPSIGKVGVVGLTVYQTTPVTAGRVNFQMLGELGADSLANLLYVPRYPEAQPAYLAIQSAFADRGLQLLEPAQFLDTEKKHGYFYNRQFEMSTLAKMIQSGQKRVKGNATDDVIGSVRGTRELGYVQADIKLWREIGQWVGDLGLDSALVLETEVAIHRGKLMLTAIRGAIIGPNKVPENPEHKKFYAPFGPLKGWMQGLMYGTIEIVPPKKPILMTDVSQKSVGKTDYISDLMGLDVIYGRIAGRLIDHTNAEISKLRAMGEKNKQK